jgi:hypothetical protein
LLMFPVMQHLQIPRSTCFSTILSLSSKQPIPLRQLTHTLRLRLRAIVAISVQPSLLLHVSTPRAQLKAHHISTLHLHSPKQSIPPIWLLYKCLWAHVIGKKLFAVSWMVLSNLILYLSTCPSRQHHSLHKRGTSLCFVLFRCFKSYAKFPWIRQYTANCLPCFGLSSFSWLRVDTHGQYHARPTKSPETRPAV